MGESKRGRPSKFTDAIAEKLYSMAREGKTDREMARAISVSVRTLAYWKVNNPDFLQSLNENKDIANGLVEASLFQRACGYSHPETKVFYDSERGRIVEHKILKHYPPDSTAMIFWLKNREPDRWRENPEQGGGEQELPKPIYELINGSSDKTSA